ncbi:Protein mpe1 [Entomophthora muscae]|uniref:Protein mpe1 n=1 Tax=Entomophthora muscae TaxID=34485 RepID=A0ACC2TBF6_9FUNG|nr:Protein mpe1 [Entomophthora muscae]
MSEEFLLSLAALMPNIISPPPTPQRWLLAKEESENRTEAGSAGALDASLDLGLGMPLSLDGVLPGESEEDKLKSLFDQSSMQWGQQPPQSTGFQGGHKNHNNSHRGNHVQGVPLSSTYVCHRCGIKGHYVQNCPSIHDKKLAQPKVKRTTGIPRSFLKNVEAIPEGKGAMITSDGALVVAQTNDNAWKKFQLTQRGSAVSSDILRETAPVPENLSCNLCHKLLTAAVSVPCCSKSFCLDCITDALLEKPQDLQFICPSCETQNIVPDSLVVEHSLRSQVDEHLRLWAIELQGDLLSNETDDLLPKEGFSVEMDTSPPPEPQKIVSVVDSSEDREFNQRHVRNFASSRSQDVEHITLASDSNFDVTEQAGSDSFQSEAPQDPPTLRWTYGGGMSEQPLSPSEVARLNKLPALFADGPDSEHRGRSKERQQPRRDLRQSSARGDEPRQRTRYRTAAARSSRSPSFDDRRQRTSTRHDYDDRRTSRTTNRRASSPRISSQEEPRTRARRSRSTSRNQNRDSSRTRTRRRSPSREVSPDRRYRSERRTRHSPERRRSPKPSRNRSPRPARRSADAPSENRSDTTRRRSEIKISHSSDRSPNTIDDSRLPVSRRLGKRERSLEVEEPKKVDIFSRVGPANALPLSSRLGERVDEAILDSVGKKRRKPRRRDSKGKAIAPVSPVRVIRIAHTSKRD